MDTGTDERSNSNVQELFRLHYLGLVRLAVRLVDDQESAEDLVQDVFVDLTRRPVELDDPLRYLRRAVVNRSRSMLRRRRIARAFWARPPGHEVAEPADEPPLRQFERQQMLGASHDCRAGNARSWCCATTKIFRRHRLRRFCRRRRARCRRR
jgi:DNA-directed RNA polymerase specialized sigma24 family protein